jgi:hypothetical protein
MASIHVGREKRKEKREKRKRIYIAYPTRHEM